MNPQLSDLYDPRRHEALTDEAWSEDRARAAIGRICAAAEAEFDEAEGSWLLHPLDDPAAPGARSVNAYFGATGVVWALRDLASLGAVTLARDYTRWIEGYPERARLEAAHEQHGTASYLFGESAPLLLAWQTTRRADFADRLHDLVRGNLHNPVHEPLWGNAGTLLAAIAMAEADLPEAERARWQALVREGVQALFDDMAHDPDDGHWLWRQDMYGRVRHFLGAGHGLAGNAYPALRAAGLVDATVADTLLQRCFDTLSATALQAVSTRPDGSSVPVVNWHPITERERIAAATAAGERALVQDCHGAPGIVCRLATAPAAWDALLRAAGEMTWIAGPLAKGPSLCHGTAGNAMACLKLWQRFAEPLWLERARRMAMHAAAQVEQARARYGQGRHSLWTGDLGVACVLWNCVCGEAGFPTLDRR